MCRRHQVKVSQSPSRSFHSILSFSLVFSGYHIVSYRILVCVCVCVCVLVVVVVDVVSCIVAVGGCFLFLILTEAVESTQSEAEWITVQAGLVDAYTTSGATATPVLW